MTKPVVHAMSGWQYVAGWCGIKTGAWCNTKVLARRTALPVTCRECQRALAGETHG